MTGPTPLSRAELDDRIAIIRDNIRQLTEQAAAMSGAADEARNADRIAQQNEEFVAASSGYYVTLAHRGLQTPRYFDQQFVSDGMS